MDKSRIYIKTPLGEQAVKERQRLPQRELRIALIMIDGHSSIAELMAKAGNSAQIEQAFINLEKAGFILPLEGKPESGIATNSDDEVLDISSEEPITIPAASAKKKNSLPLTVKARAKPLKKQHNFVPSQSTIIQVLPGFVEPLSENPSVRSAIALERSALSYTSKLFLLVIGLIKTILAAILSLVIKFFSLFTSSKKAKPVVARIDTNKAVTVNAAVPQKVKLPRRYRKKAIAPKVVGVTVMVLILGVAYWILNIDRYIPNLEKVSTEILKQPIKLRGLDLITVPRFGVLIERIEVGESAELRMKNVKVFPEITSLWGPKLIIKKIEMDFFGLDTKSFMKLPELIKQSHDSQRVALENLQFANLELILDRSNDISGVGGEVSILSDGTVQKVTLNGVKDSVKIELVPSSANDKFAVNMTAQNWRLPGASQIEFVYFGATGEATTDKVVFKEIDSRVFEGSAKGYAVLSWEKGVVVSGELSGKELGLHKLGSAFGASMFSSGKVNGKMTFSAAAREYDKWLNFVRLDADFVMYKGLLDRVNLVEAARGASRGGWRNGETKFEEILGNVSIANQNYRFRNLRMSSGLVSARGYYEINKDNELSGKLDVEINAAGSQIKVPLAIEGPLSQPVVYPAKNFAIRPAP